MKSLKHILLSLLVILMASCAGEDANLDDATIYLKISGESKTSGSDLLGVQVYVVDGTEDIPYCSGLFSSWDNLSFLGASDYAYKVVVTLIYDGQNVIYQDNTSYGRPFETSLDNMFIYASDELSALQNSTATLLDGSMKVVPNVLRYYGQSQKTVSLGDMTITAELKCVSFGVKVEGTQDQITLKLSGAPDVETLGGETSYYTFNYITSAYSANESVEPYSENITTEVLKSNVSIYSGTITYKRNMATVLALDKDGLTLGFDFEQAFDSSSDATAYITKVLDYRPAPGYYVNTLPSYEDGNSQEDMNEKVLEKIGNNAGGMITLGAYGGYVTVGFDHSIENKDGLRDFRVLGNPVFNSTAEYTGGGCEPGIVMVSKDVNGNGLPDDIWYELQGSSHIDHSAEPWYTMAQSAGNDVDFYFGNYQITYTKSETTTTPWQDNQGGSGSNAMSYFPSWIGGETLSFTGSRLPQNGILSSGSYILYQFVYGYADNAANTDDNSSFDISWAVDSSGAKANLDSIDFIKIYTGVSQVNGFLAECSTEIVGVEDLHILGEQIATR